MALEHSSTERNSTKANFFSVFMYTFTTLSPGARTPPICASAALKSVAMEDSSTVGGRPPR